MSIHTRSGMPELTRENAMKGKKCAKCGKSACGCKKMAGGKKGGKQMPVVKAKTGYGY